jgi:hypothetical protein
VSYISLVLQRIMQWRLLNVGMKASAEEIVRALESVRVRRVVGMGKGKGLLFNCTGSAEVAATLKDRSGEPMSPIFATGSSVSASWSRCRHWSRKGASVGGSRLNCH